MRGQSALILSKAIATFSRAIDLLLCDDFQHTTFSQQIDMPIERCLRDIEQQFCDAITADHYVFCGNGEHANPDLRVVSLIAERRFAEGAGAPFTFWFNSHSSVAETAAGRAHMSEVETLVGQLEQQSGGRLRSESLLGDSFEVPV